MSDRTSRIQIFDAVDEYIQNLRDPEKAKILAQIGFIKEDDHSVLYTKQLSGPIRELIIKQHRLVYFWKNDTFYFVDAFKKQSAKTPKRTIEHAKALYKALS